MSSGAFLSLEALEPSDKDTKINKYINNNYIKKENFTHESIIFADYVKVISLPSISQLSITYNEITYSFPSGMEMIFNCLKQSRGLLDLTDNWDEEGAEGYSEDTWTGFAIFLMNYSNEIYNQTFSIIETPKIYPGPKGSIDIYWENKTYRFVVNVAKGGKSASFYIDNHADQISEGQFLTHNFNINLLPLATKDR